MKKSLIALAAFAAVGAASAQVTVYGKLDVGVANITGDGTSAGLNGWETSRVGLKAEQKAGDLTLSLKLEGKVGDSNHDAAFSGFGRVATVDVSGSFGSLTLGTQWTPFDNAIWTSDALEYNGFTPLVGLGAAWNYDLGNTGGGNAARSVQYTTPDMNGFQAMVLTAPKYKSTKYSGAGLNYAKGPLTVNFANQRLEVAGIAGKLTGNVLSFQYDLGTVTVSGGVVNSKDVGVSDKGFIAGVKMPVGADSVSIGFSSNKNTVAGESFTNTAMGAQYIKSLSKAAVAYFGIAKVESDRKIGAGVRYNF